MKRMANEKWYHMDEYDKTLRKHCKNWVKSHRSPMSISPNISNEMRKSSKITGGWFITSYLLMFVKSMKATLQAMVFEVLVALWSLQRGFHWDDLVLTHSTVFQCFISVPYSQRAWSTKAKQSPWNTEVRHENQNFTGLKRLSLSNIKSSGFSEWSTASSHWLHLSSRSTNCPPRFARDPLRPQ